MQMRLICMRRAGLWCKKRAKDKVRKCPFSFQLEFRAELARDNGRYLFYCSCNLLS